MTTKNGKASPVDEAAIIKKLSIVSVVGNVALSGGKLFAGIYGHSGAMVSDAAHSLSDVLTTLVAYVGVKLSQKAPDNDHPYGHERIECLASLLLGILLTATGLGIGKHGLTRIFSDNADALAVPGVIALAAAVVSILGKEAMYRYTLHYAKIIDSAAFTADAWHHRSDALSSVGALVGIAGAMLGCPILDSVAGVVICLFVLKVAFDVLKDAAKKMLDSSCGEKYEAELRQFIASQPDVVSVDLLRTRMFGNKIYIDAEIQIDGDKSLRESHAIAEQVHNRVEERYDNVKHIMIHVNPTP